MTYQETIAHFEQLGKLGIQLGLVRIERLLNHMGNPHHKLKFIHVAGTNGKGSTCYMLSNILSHSGYKTGLFTSPYILDFRESIQINMKMISEQHFLECAEYVYHCAEQSTINNDPPTQFEILTAIALEFFVRQKCDIVLLEVGLGGTLDSTNIIPPPLLQIITSISLDHTNILGSTIEEITKEKSGIIKSATTIVYPKLPKKVLQILKKKCKLVNSKLVQPDCTSLQFNTNSFGVCDFSYEGISYKKSLLGEVQLYNAIVVITASKELNQLGFSLPSESICYGVEHTFIPARMEILSESPLVLLDGSHNEDGAIALKKTLATFPKTSIKMIMGVLEDKNIYKILENTATLSNIFIAVSPNHPRALSSKKLAEVSKQYCNNVKQASSLEEAVNSAFLNLKESDILVICGSLYLSHDIRPILIRKIKSLSMTKHKN